MRSFFLYCCPLLLIFLFLLAGSCQKTVPVHDVISLRARSSQVLADGSSLDTLYADLPVNAVAANRGIFFQAGSGLFPNGDDTITVFANRTDIDPGKITALVILKASLRSGPDTITASTTAVPQVTDSLTLTLLPSLADSLTLTPSSYTLPDSFGSAVTIKATLFNSALGMVSGGTRIAFSAYYLNNMPAGGVFLPQNLLSSDTISQASTLYMPSLPLVTDTATYIAIRAGVVGANGIPGTPTNTVVIYISK